ncbi:MAG: hypothetical protein ACI9JM_000094 [Halioglobus sp.]|jgi:hypothetical protein
MKYFAMCLCITALVACSPKEEVIKIDGSFVSFVEIKCGDAQFSQEQYDNIFSKFPEEERVPIYTELTEKLLNCEVLKNIQASLIERNAQLTEGLLLPSPEYSFELSLSANDVREVGYFDGEDECSAAKETLVSMGLEAEPCAQQTIY